MTNPARYNRQTQLDPGWTLEQLWRASGVHVESPADIPAIRAAQTALGVTADGYVGPGTIALIQRRLGLHVHRWAGLPRAGKTPGGVTCIVLHHSVTRSHAGMVRVLDARGLSTHYSIEPDGTRHELCDPDRMAAHAGKWNRASIGIDLINPYSPKLWRAHEPWAAPVPTGTGWGERYGALRRRSVIPDTPAALASLRVLLEELCGRYKLAMTWPAPGERPQLDPRAAAQQYGVLPHGALSGDRWDGWGALMGLEAMDVGRLDAVA